MGNTKKEFIAAGKKVRAERLPLSADMQANFEALECRLSPENLTCDGELPVSQVKARRSQINKEWHALEKQVGRFVSMDEVVETMVARLRCQTK